MATITGSARRGRSDLAEYVAAIRAFSRNARLYLVHIVGMDLIHGTWEVLFNLYLLALFTPEHGVLVFGYHLHPIEFVGLRLAVGAIASGIGSIPAGLLSDRIGRKASFIIGDGGGALIALLNVLITNPVFLLCTPLVSSVMGSLHHVAETAFMAENSEPRERVHLFSVGHSLSTAVGVAGSLIAASYPALVAWVGDHLVAYRVATFAGIALWFLSLIPALMLREHHAPALAAGPANRVDAEGAPSRRVSIGLRSIRHPALVAKLVATGALMSVASAAALPFLNVFFHEHLHADEHEIGVTFAAIAGFVAFGSLLAPFVAARMNKVDGVVAVRVLAVPFVLALGFFPEAAAGAGVGLSLAGVLVAMRAILMSVSGPLAEAFAMEVLDPSERATMVGIQSAASSVLRAGAAFLGSTWMARGDFQSPFVVAAACYLGSVALFWLFFRRSEPRLAVEFAPARAGA
jgi:MFS family permease